MKRFGYGLLTLVLLVVTTCTALRAEPQAHEKPNEKKSPTCPLHSKPSDHSQPASQACGNCLSAHFVSESKVHFAAAPVAVITPLDAVRVGLPIIVTAISEATPAGFTLDTSPLVLRV